MPCCSQLAFWPPTSAACCAAVGCGFSVSSLPLELEPVVEDEFEFELLFSLLRLQATTANTNMKSAKTFFIRVHHVQKVENHRRFTLAAACCQQLRLYRNIKLSRRAARVLFSDSQTPFNS